MITLGTDIVEIERIRSSIQRSGDRFLSKIYTRREIEICSNKPSSDQNYAGKFAAKEAVKKALLSANPTLAISFDQIEVDNNTDGCPIVNLVEPLKKICKLYKIEVSISHVKEYAIAVAMVII